MALSGIISGAYSGYELQTIWTATQNIAGNYSDITAIHKLVCTDALNINTRTNTCTIDGTTKNFTSPAINTAGGETIALGETTQRVYHNADGTKSFEMRTIFNIQTEIGGQYVSAIIATGNITLDKIARKATITSANNFTDEEDPSLTFTNTGSFYLTAYIEYGATRITKTAGTATSGKVTFNLTEAQRNSMRNATPTSPEMAITYGLITTIQEQTYTDTLERIMTIVNAEPTAPSLTYTDTNAETIAITGDASKIIQNKSILTATIGNATAKKGASIVSYITKINGIEVTGNGTQTLGIIDLATNGILTTIVTDSRGLQTATSIQVTMESYNEPTALIDLHRNNNIDTTTKLTVYGTFSSLDGQNYITIEYATKRADLTTWSNWTAIANNTETSISLNNAYKWDLKVRIKDLLTDYIEYAERISNGTPLIFIDPIKESVGFNCMPKRNKSFEINGTGATRYLGNATASNINISQTTYELQTFTATSIKTNKSIEATAGAIKILHNGCYKITIQARWQDVNANNICMAGISVNNSTTDEPAQTIWQTNTGKLTTNGSIIIELQANDIIKIITYSNEATTIQSAIVWFEEINIDA